MAIKVKCKCGKAFGAPEKYAGKRVKCPGCGEIVGIPDNAAPTEQDAGTSQPAKARPLKVTCACGKALAVKPELAGKKIKCPGCSQPIAVPASTAARQPAKSASAVNGAGDTDVMADLLDEVDLSATSTGQRCPECRAEMGPEDILCIECGYRVDRGTKLETKRVVKPQTLSLKAGVPPQAKAQAVPKAVTDLAKWLRVLGYINLVVGVLILVLWAAVFSMGSSSQLDPSMQQIIAGFFGVTAVLVIIYIAAITGGLFFAAKQVVAGKRLGRILAIIVAVLFLPSVPIGTVIGVLLLMKALSADVAAYCTK